MVKLTSNLLDSLAEKLFKLREGGFNEKMDSIFKYMLCSSRCKDSVLRQFKGMKKVLFRHNYFGATPSQVESRADDDQLQADFYYEAEDEGRLDRQEPMPFSVDGWFVGYLMRYGLLRVKHIVFERSLVERMGSRGRLPAEELSEMRVIDLVSELLGLEEKSPGVSQCQQSDLQLDCVEVRIAGPSKLDDLSRFIALAPKRLVIMLENQVPESEEELTSERLQFSAIEIVRVEVEDSVKNEAAWPDFLRFLTASCPKLRLLDVRYTVCAVGAGGPWLGDWIEKMARSLQDEIFQELKRNCGDETVVNFEMRSSLSEWEIDSDHPVLRLGEPVDKPPFVISRSLVVKREELQAPWHISFHIGEEDPDEEDYDDYDGFDDYDAFDDYEGFDDYDGFDDYGDCYDYDDCCDYDPYGS